MRFELGRLVATPAALHSLTREQIILALARHEAGDWGELDAEDQRANEQALTCGARILSAYTFGNAPEGSVKVWVITEADRRFTTILLPEDY